MIRKGYVYVTAMIASLHDDLEKTRMTLVFHPGNYAGSSITRGTTTGCVVLKVSLLQGDALYINAHIQETGLLEDMIDEILDDVNSYERSVETLGFEDLRQKHLTGGK